MNRTLGSRDVRDLLRETFTIYKNNFWRLAAIMLVAAVPGAVVGFLINFFTPVQAESATIANMERLILLIPLYLVAIVVGMLAAGAAVHAIAEQYFSQPVDIGRAFSFAWHRLGSLVGASFLVMLAVLGMAITIIGIPAAIYFAVTWVFMLQVIMLEGCGARDALSHSLSLVKNGWWRVLGIILLFYVIIMGIYMVLYIPVFIGTMVWTISGAITGAMEQAAVQPPIWLMLMTMIVALVFTAVGTPIFAIGTTLLYFDLRVRKEGYDLGGMASELGLPGASTGTVASPPQ
jgi:hypothetical protein